MLELENVRWIGLAVVLIDIVALATVWFSRRHSSQAKVVWTIIIAVLPIVGALGWAILGRERKRRG